MKAKTYVFIIIFSITSFWIGLQVSKVNKRPLAKDFYKARLEAEKLIIADGGTYLQTRTEIQQIINSYGYELDIDGKIGPASNNCWAWALQNQAERVKKLKAVRVDRH